MSGVVPVPALLLGGALGAAALSGLPLLVRGLDPGRGQRLAALMLGVASLAGLAGAFMTLLARTRLTYLLTWPFPFGPASCGIDPLSAFFCLPILLVSACCAVYGLSYRPADVFRHGARRLPLFFGLLTAAMLGVVLARSAGLLLLAWEVMALSAYFVLTTDDHTPAVRDAGTLYLICTHLGTLGLFALFALLKGSTGSFAFPAAGTLSAASPAALGMFLTALYCFGFKAGLMPLHIWLPSAHANAPSHVSAVMSGVILKVGIYGLVRVLSFFSGMPMWWGLLLLGLGAVSAVGGVTFALGQHDLKRLLAYHSIENIGIIVMGLGTAVIGTALGAAPLVVLGLAGALLHVLNHALFKALLFLGAGSVIHAAGTREIDRMGGLLRLLPWTGAAFLAGAVAICGLPPLNGFVSELLVYLGFFTGAVHLSGGAAAGLALAAPALALVGGLALACFVKVWGVVFLGAPRAESAGHPREAGRSMLLPMGLLALVCLCIGVMPGAVAPLLDAALACCLPEGTVVPPLAQLAPLDLVTLPALALLVLTAFLYLWLRGRLLRSPVGRAATWGCGYPAATPRMQYTASSFAAMLLELFAGLLRPQRRPPAVSGPFPPPSAYGSRQPETVLEGVYLPLLDRLYRRILPIRRLQHGHLHLYILYTFITLLVLILISLD